MTLRAYCRPLGECSKTARFEIEIRPLKYHSSEFRT